MTKKEPLKYRLISKKHSQGLSGCAGMNILVLCLGNGLHAVVSLNESIEFKSLGDLPTNMADSVAFARCDCSRHLETAPRWLAELADAFLHNPRKGVHPKRNVAKPKKRPTMGR
ncbi:MAG: hypothetical protein WC551_03200 [Patescibacteria group bacterium]